MTKVLSQFRISTERVPPPGEAAAIAHHGYLGTRSAVAEILRTAATGAKGRRQTIPRAAAKQAGMKVRTADGT